MYGSGRIKRGRWWVLVVVLVMAVLATLMVAGCGGDDPAADGSSTTASSSSASSAAQSGGDGAMLAEEILGAFDELVAEVSGLATPKPEPATLKPQLDELYASYLPIMTALNARYLALRDSDETAFQDCNRFISDNRPQRVSAKDNALAEPVKYYNFDLGDQEMVVLITEKPVELLDVAVNQN